MAESRQSTARAVIVGVAGERLSAAERRLFETAPPLGFILFARNCREPDQVRALVAELRETVGRGDAPILIDQEGGRVQRLQPPHWRAAPAMAGFALRAESDETAAIEAAWLNARLIADDLAALGITVDCAPVLDVPGTGADPIIGDRACGTTPELAAMIGRAVCAGLLAGGVLPVIKHIPGHGRATVDSHAALPVVEASRNDLEHVDFAPFTALADMPWAMTAHVVYTALDPQQPATTSAKVIDDVIRGQIGFDGVLVSDDICMRALAGAPAERALAALAAGCDVALHCNGDFNEMQAVLGACPPLLPRAHQRLERAKARLAASAPFDAAAASARLAELLAVA